MSAKAQTASTKRINKVAIKRILDDSPDTSWIGEYADRPETEFAIDRDHDTDCTAQPYNQATDEGKRILDNANDYLQEQDTPDEAHELLEQLRDGDFCNCSGSFRERGTYRYFNPGTVEPFKADASWIPTEVTNKREYWHKAMVQNALADYKRMEALNNGDFYFIGVAAEAEVLIPSGTDSRGGTCYTVQHITSGGLWGIESDSDASYLAEIEQEQLSELRDQLHAIGFSRRAIAAAFRNVQKTEGI